MDICQRCGAKTFDNLGDTLGVCMTCYDELFPPLEDITKKYPDIAKAIDAWAKAQQKLFKEESK